MSSAAGHAGGEDEVRPDPAPGLPGGADTVVLPPLDPLSRCHVTDTPPLGGRIKVRPEDFLVDELPLADPAGAGEHLYLGVEKLRVSHSEMIGTLCRHFGVRPRDIGFAGMKDKHGVTRQTVSVHLPEGDPPSVELSHERIRILWAARHGRKLRRGHLAGNRFSIRIREIDALLAPRVLRALRELERLGVPTAFGPQRFGYRLNNHLVGACLVQEAWGAALDELLGARGTPFPEYQRDRRELYDAGRYREAAALWTPADRAELIAAKALAAGRSPKQACLETGSTTISFWLCALQSAIFNRTLDHRVRAATLDRLVEGDIAWIHESRRIFEVGAEEMADPDCARRVRMLEVSPTGPLWGSAMKRPRGAVAEAEAAVLAEMGLAETLLEGRRVPSGERRPLRAPIRNIEVEGGTDEHGHYVRVAFELPRGVYATVVLGEIMKGETLER